jgi:neurotransmitter:Na+ symporter, NSS family
MAENTLAHHRPQWKTHIGFLFAAVGSAIGLGNIWRFSYLCYKNGGGAFLVPYVIALFIVGIPLMILEIGLGHKMRGSAPASLASISKKWEWLGWWQIIFLMFGIVLYYAVIISWCCNFFVFSFNLSWGSDPNAFFFQKFLSVSDQPFSFGNIRTPILIGLAVVWILNWIIVFKGIQKGIERASKIFMPLLFLLTAGFVIWGLQLPGAAKGIALYLKPDWNALLEKEVWIDAFSQIFFTLSLCFGIMIAYASYLPKKSAIVRDSLVISCINCFFSLFVGLGVFAVLGYMAHTTGQPISEVVDKSIGLAFVVFPKAISLLPAFGNLFGVLFFGCLIIAGLSSLISMFEAFVSGVVDKFHYSRKVVVSVVSVLGFLGGVVFATQAGLLWLDIVDHFLTQYGVVLAGIAECIIVAWIYRSQKLRQHINNYSLWKIGRGWEICVKFIAPSVLFFLFVWSLANELSQPYGGYSRLAIVLIGRDWLVATLFFAIIVASHPWRADPKDRMLS